MGRFLRPATTKTSLPYECGLDTRAVREGDALDAKILRGLMRGEPFQPFRIFLIDGSHYDIPARGWMAITKHEAAVGIGKDAESDPDRLILCSLAHITHIEVPLRKRILRRRGKRRTP